MAPESFCPPCPVHPDFSWCGSFSAYSYFAGEEILGCAQGQVRGFPLNAHGRPGAQLRGILGIPPHSHQEDPSPAWPSLAGPGLPSEDPRSRGCQPGTQVEFFLSPLAAQSREGAGAGLHPGPRAPLHSDSSSALMEGAGAWGWCPPHLPAVLRPLPPTPALLTPPLRSLLLPQVVMSAPPQGHVSCCPLSSTGLDPPKGTHVH